MAARSQLIAAEEEVQPHLLAAGPRKLRTVVVDDSPEFLQATWELLELEPQIELVARAEKGAGAMEAVLRLNPDLVLMDVHMPYLDGLTVAEFFAGRFPAVRVVLMSSEDTPELRKACRRSGALAFINKVNFRHDFDAVLKDICLGA